jgi:cytochrome c oxidase assembly protein subunit 15
MIFRIVHGCFAQIELCLLVAIAATLSPSWSAAGPVSGLSKTRAFAWITFGVIFLQLLVGATMRHLGVGLIIPTFPQASPDGSWLPAVHNLFVDLNFTHTRFGALLVGLSGVILSRRVLLTCKRETGLRGPALVLLGLIASQIALGILILLTHRSILPTTLHVINGAAILATSMLLALRTTLLEPNAEPSEYRGAHSGSISAPRTLPGTTS